MCTHVRMAGYAPEMWLTHLLCASNSYCEWQNPPKVCDPTKALEYLWWIMRCTWESPSPPPFFFCWILRLPIIMPIIASFTDVLVHMHLRYVFRPLGQARPVSLEMSWWKHQKMTILICWMMRPLEKLQVSNSLMLVALTTCVCYICSLTHNLKY